METPRTLLTGLQTRGDFRRVIERANSANRDLPSELPPEHPIWDVWAIMRDQYGAQWTHGEEPSMGWVLALRDMSQEQLRNGVYNLSHREDTKWPPNAQEFRDLCLTNFAWETRCHKILPTDNMIEDITGKEKRCAEGLEKIRALKEQFGF